MASNFTRGTVHTLGINVGTSIRQSLTFTAHHSPTYLKETLPTFLYESVRYVRSFPLTYRRWWFDLLSTDPVHVIVETLLLAFVVYMILAQRWAATARREKRSKDALTAVEREELIKEWKPEPLVPEGYQRRGIMMAAQQRKKKVIENKSGGGYCGGGRGEIVVTKVHGMTMDIERHYTTTSADGGTANKNSSSTIIKKQEHVLNFASNDFLGLGSSSDDTTLKDTARETLAKYGCGSCGPRGFYGTIDVHLDLERSMSNFCGTDGAIMYSDGASAASSTVAAFAKRGDLVVVDEGIHESLQTGVKLSRAHVKYFKHNDMNDLRRVLESIRDSDLAIGRKPSDIRRFIIVEGLYKNYGHVCPFDELLPLKREFSYRLVVDESLSFGTLGKTGRGALEHYGASMMTDAELVIVSLENSLASIGGITVGDEESVDHQRLSGAGYCFSASAPPFVATAAMASLRKLQDDPETFVGRLATNRELLLRGITEDDDEGGMDGLLTVISDPLSSIVFVRLASSPPSSSSSKTIITTTTKTGTSAATSCPTQTTTSSDPSSTPPPPQTATAATTTTEEQDGGNDGDGDEESLERQLLDDIVTRCLDGGVAMVSTSHVGVFLHKRPPPAIRLAVTAQHTQGDIEACLETLRRATREVLLSSSSSSS